MAVGYLETTASLSFKNHPVGKKLEVLVDHGEKSFRLELLEPEEGIATVFPVERGQENAGSIDATSRFGSVAIEGATIGPCTMPIEGAMGEFEWGDLRAGEELVFQNQRNGMCTFTYTGRIITAVLVELTE